MVRGEPDPPLERHAKSAPGAKVRLCCAVCGGGHEVDVGEVIWLLKALGLGDELSPTGDAAKLARDPCVRCGATAWRASPA